MEYVTSCTCAGPHAAPEMCFPSSAAINMGSHLFGPLLSPN